MPHADLIATLLPPVSYDTTAITVRAETTADGKALDRALAATAGIEDGLKPLSSPPWMAEYEAVYGLPALCDNPKHNHAQRGGWGGGPRQTILFQDRQTELAMALLERGGVTKDWMVRYAKMAGGDGVTVATTQPFEAGRSVAGDCLTNGLWRFVFFVHAPGTVCRRFAAGRSLAGEPLSLWGNDLLECVINRKKPAHTLALFTYGESQNAQN